MSSNYTKHLFFIFSVYLTSYASFGQCADSDNIYSFVYDDKTYEVIKENKTWEDAAACAVARGGILAEINDQAEQDAIFNELNSNAAITNGDTQAPDGGGGAYVWIGGNDLATEGDWVWDGDNDDSSTQFWMGTETGSPVDGLYNNWGNEPDNFQNQDALGLSLNGWPRGSMGQWNDVDHLNTLFYVVEHATVLSTAKNELNSKIKIFPNPATDEINIISTDLQITEIVLISSSGQRLNSFKYSDGISAKNINISKLSSGLYFLKIRAKNGKFITKSIIK